MRSNRMLPQKRGLQYARRNETLKWLTIVFLVLGAISSASAMKIEKDIENERTAREGRLPALPNSLMKDLGFFAFYSILNPMNWAALGFSVAYWNSIACPKCKQRQGNRAPGTQAVCPACKSQFVNR